MGLLDLLVGIWFRDVPCFCVEHVLQFTDGSPSRYIQFGIVDQVSTGDLHTAVVINGGVHGFYGRKVSQRIRIHLDMRWKDIDFYGLRIHTDSSIL